MHPLVKLLGSVFCPLKCTRDDDPSAPLFLTEIGRTWRHSDVIYDRPIRTPKRYLVRMSKIDKGMSMRSLVAAFCFVFELSEEKWRGLFPRSGRGLKSSGAIILINGQTIIQNIPKRCILWSPTGKLNKSIIRCAMIHVRNKRGRKWFDFVNSESIR